MKKFICSLIIILTTTVLVACNLTISKPTKSPVENGKSLTDTARTIDISEGVSDDGSSFYYSCDLNYDGVDENISMNVIWTGDYECYLELSIGDEDKELELIDGFIEKVYSCDINENDGIRDIAIITNEVSSDPRIRILSYSDGLEAYNFSEEYEYEEEISDGKWIGYACSYYFNVNDDDTITIEEQTNSCGMWSVYRNYELNNGTFKEIIRDEYEILPDFMEREYFPENISSEEKEKWKDGYVKAHCSYSNESISISEGEYIKPLYDDDNDKLYVEKENGETGYIDLYYNSGFNGFEFNEMFFYLAG